MEQKKTRLFVIIDPDADHQVAFVKAMLIAKLGNFHIHAFLCVYKDINEAGEFASRKDFKRHTLADARKWLDDLLQPCNISDIPFSSEVVWNSRWVDTALHAVEKSGCDLVIKSSFHHSKARRFFSKTSDYNLMRHCARPILFTHDTQEWHSNRLLACVDLESDDPRHIHLNDVIISNARVFAEVIGMELYVAACFEGEIKFDHLPIRRHGRQSHAEQLAALYEVEPERIILRQGSVIDSLSQVCEITDPCILMIGTLARTGIGGKLIGNTAEKLLDLVDADVLTVI